MPGTCPGTLFRGSGVGKPGGASHLARGDSKLRFLDGMASGCYNPVWRVPGYRVFLGWYVGINPLVDTLTVRACLLPSPMGLVLIVLITPCFSSALKPAPTIVDAMAKVPPKFVPL